MSNAAVIRGAVKNRSEWVIVLAVLALLGLSAPLAAQQSTAANSVSQAADQTFNGKTTQDFNRRIGQLVNQEVPPDRGVTINDYRIGPEDLLKISVLEAPDLSRTVRVSAGGDISLPLLGVVHAAGLSSRGLEAVLENLLRRTYMKNPQVSVFVKEMRSHPVSVFGAVEKPGVFQIRGAKTLIEVLSLAQGLAVDAGDTVIVMRHAGDPVGTTGATAKVVTPAAKSIGAGKDQEENGLARDDTPNPQPAEFENTTSIKISLKRLLDSGDSRYNVLVYPGDVVKVTRAGIVYVVGEVRRPGGFLLKTNENISVLQALALAEGLTPTAKGKHARIIVGGAGSGSKKIIAINLDKILKGKAPDPMLQSRDVLFVPNSGRKSAFRVFYRSVAGIIPAVSGASVYRW